MKWEEFVERRILSPLGMAGTNFTTTAALAASDHATPHRHNAEGKIETISWYPMTRPDPAGSVNSNVRDLCRWISLPSRRRPVPGQEVCILTVSG